MPATRLRLSSGGGYLYASHPGNGTVVRYLPGTLGTDNTIRLGVTTQPGGSPLYANDLAPHPKEPRTLAIALADPEIHPTMRGPVVFDDDVPRPLTGRGHSIWGVAWNADGSRLYGFTLETSPSSVIRYALDQGGLTAEAGWTRGLQNRASALNQVGEYLHSNTGEVLREHDMHRAGEYITPWPCLFAVPEKDAAKVFALCGAEDDDEVETALVVHAFNARSSSGEAFTYREVALDANDMVYDRSRGRIYLSSPGRAEYAPQAILSLDPVTGLFDAPRPIGSEPNTLILAGEDEYLYAGRMALPPWRGCDSTPGHATRPSSWAARRAAARA